MRRLLIAAVCLCAGLTGCENSPSESSQDKAKAQPRPMVKPGPQGKPMPIVTVGTAKP